MVDIKLKPCPFCGCELERREDNWIVRPGLRVKEIVHVHPKRRCILDYHRYRFDLNPEKIDQWNRRAGDSDETD